MDTVDKTWLEKARTIVFFYENWIGLKFDMVVDTFPMQQSELTNFKVEKLAIYE